MRTEEETDRSISRNETDMAGEQLELVHGETEGAKTLESQPELDLNGENEIGTGDLLVGV